MKKFISFSGGVESTTMCILWGGEATPIFCDTGAEHKEMYKRLDFVESRLKKLHGDSFKVIRIKAKVKARTGKIVDSLMDYIKEQEYLPSPHRRYCTGLFKIQPIDTFLSNQGKCELMIGLNLDEEHNRTGNKELQKNVTYTYPLIDKKLDRDDCKDILTTYGLNPDFPPYMDRGGCKLCPFKSKKEYKAMVHFSPDEAEEIAKLEEDIQGSRKKYFRIVQNLPQFRKFIGIEKNSLFSADEIKKCYQKPSTHKSCGIFCHR